MTRHSAVKTRHAALAAVVSAWIVVSCADKVTGPPLTAPFAIGPGQRTALVAAVRYAARDASIAVLADREGAERIRAALVQLAERIANDDRVGARRAVDGARSAVASYRTRAPGDAIGLMELEGLSLVLEHVALLAGDAPDSSLYSDAGG